MQLTRLASGRTISLAGTAWIAGGLALAALMAAAITEMRASYLAVLLLPALLYAGLRNPFFFPLGIYAFLVPFDSLLVITGESTGPTITKMLGVATIGVLMLKGAAERQLRAPQPGTLWLVAFVLWGMISGWWAIDASQTLYRIPTAAGLLLLYGVVAAYRCRERDYELLSACCLAGGIIAAVCILYFYISRGVIERATLAVGEHQTDINEAAFTLLLPAALCVERIRTLRPLGKLSFAAAFAAILFAVIITGSRGALLGLLCVLSIQLASMRHKAMPLALAATCLVFILLLTPDFFVERWREALDSGGAGRTSIWYVGLRSLERYWLLGAGLHNFPFAYTEFAEYAPTFKGLYRGSHNIYLEAFVELGIVGLFFMVCWIWQHFRPLLRPSPERAASAASLAAAFAGCLAASFFVGTLWGKSLWLVLLLIAAHTNLDNGRPRS